MTSLRNTFVFLKSDTSVLDNVTKFHRFDFVNPIQAKADELIQVQVSEIEIPLTYYNVTDENNVFDLKVTFSDDATDTLNKSFDLQNLTINDIVSEISAITGNDSSLTAEFITKSGKLKITATATTGKTVSRLEITALTTCNKLIGFVNTLSGTGSSITGDKLIDTNKTNNIYLETDLLLENRNSIGEKSGILTKTQMNGRFMDIIMDRPFADISMLLNKKDRYLDHINLRLVDDKNNSIDFNGHEFTVTLIFSFIKMDKLMLGELEEADDYKPFINTINTDLDEICDYEENEI